MAKNKPLVTISDITTFGNRLRKEIVKNLAWSKQLSKSVSLSTATNRNGKVSISVSVGDKGKDKSGMPLTGMAGAYEYGSGEHGETGQRYKISARLKPNLFFVSPGYTTPFIGKSVMHPGVEAREYLKKSYDSIRKEATMELRKSTRRNVIDSLNVTIREINRK